MRMSQVFVADCPSASLRARSCFFLHNAALPPPIGVGRTSGSPSLRTGQAVLPHPALQLVVHLREG